MLNAKSENEVLTIALSGHIDSTNAPEMEKEAAELRQQYPHKALVLDMENLEYISSAGLRVILRLRKQEENLSLINVSSSVYEVLDMTGFAEMMPVQKAFRRLSVEGCEVIGRGANGKVYRLDRDTIIKVYYNPDSLPDIRRERELARKALVLGIPTAIPFDVVRVGDSYGSVFELLNAKSFSKLLTADPDHMDDYVSQYVDLLKTIHSTHVKPGEMPRMKDVAVGWGNFLRDYLPAEQADRLCDLIAAVPDRDTMLHGDYHTNNLMMQDGEALLIDMDTVCVGHPIFELASMYLGFVGFGELDHEVTKKFMGLDYSLTGEFWRRSLRRYLNDADEDTVRAVERKAMLIGYARLMRRTIRREADTESGKAVIASCKKHIGELLPTIDTLDF
jgi:uncharacterized protein (TIGR02172 family)